MATEGVPALLTRLRAYLVPMMDELRGRVPASNVLKFTFNLDRQRVFTDSTVSAIGFEFKGERVDLAEHTFCTTVGRGDVRIASRMRLLEADRSPLVRAASVCSILAAR